MPQADKNLLKLLKRGDEHAFRQIYDKYKHQCYAVGLKYTRSDQMAADMVLKLFTSLWTRRHGIKDLREFLVKEMQNMAKSHLHKLADDILAKRAGKEEDDTPKNESKAG